ncbi:hypothetical protein PanWU01x14_151460 [Parasponia andersonii]|uniref:Uncharacterized protein n=1 Tax=Parasponia andersonii TaxID=3476 RepID=A0A2P5CHM8_PARAD|nr:hypothetical protein PanWU01x14_151460 [Parasponia andersonii]
MAFPSCRPYIIKNQESGSLMESKNKENKVLEVTSILSISNYKVNNILQSASYSCCSTLISKSNEIIDTAAAQ